jgi:hypothetical protein
MLKKHIPEILIVASILTLIITVVLGVIFIAERSKSIIPTTIIKADTSQIQSVFIVGDNLFIHGDTTIVQVKLVDEQSFYPVSFDGGVTHDTIEFINGGYSNGQQVRQHQIRHKDVIFDVIDDNGYKPTN